MRGEKGREAMHTGSCGTNVSHPLLVFLPGKEHSVALLSGGFFAPNEFEVHPLSTRGRGFGSRVENSRFFLRIISLHSCSRARSSSGLGKVMSSGNTL